MNLVVDIRHWLDEHGLPVPRLRKQVLRIARLIEYGGPLKPGEARSTLVECSRRPGRRPCPGLLWVIKHPDGRIHALCRQCDDENVYVSGWEDTLWAGGQMEPFTIEDVERAFDDGEGEAPAGGTLDGKATVERDRALDEAQALVYEAWEAPARKRRVELARQALAISADCADAYVLLAQESDGTLDEVTELYREGVAAGERALGERAFMEEVGHFWGILETRPYMRARQGLAGCLWEAGACDEAVKHHRDLLRLNPNDNQGTRYVLAAHLLALGRDRDVAALLEEYKDDGAAAWVYTRALLSFRACGDDARARRLLADAVTTNRHVPAFLLGKKKLPRQLPDYIGMGDENEAVVYAADHGASWKQTPGALAWLASAAGLADRLH